MRSRLRQETLPPEIAQKVLVYQVQSDWGGRDEPGGTISRIILAFAGHEGLLACLSQVREIEAYVI